jgi:signal peptidase I
LSRRRLPLLLIAVFFIAAAFTVWANKPYKVVGQSMEPGLVEGDLLVLSSDSPNVGERVVFREPDSGMLAVKSVAAGPGQRVQFRDNDLYLDGKIYRRPIYSASDLVPIIDSNQQVTLPDNAPTFPFSEAGFILENEQWKLEQTGVAFLKRPPNDSYLRRDSFHQGKKWANDLGVEVEYELLSPNAELHLVMRKGLALFTLIVSDGGSKLRLTRSDQPDNQANVLLEQVISPPRPIGSAFLTLADRAITFAIDRQPLIKARAYDLSAQPSLSDGAPDFRTLELAGIGGLGPLMLGRVRLGRDISYPSTGTLGVKEAFQLADQEFFLIGENPSESHDSRNYGAVSSDRILGTVSYRIWPRGWTDFGWAND